MNESILEIKNLVAGYGRIEVLHDISMTVGRGEIVTMVGANGAGKSTTLKSIFGLTNITSGQIMLKGEPITNTQTHNLRRRAAYVTLEKQHLPVTPCVRTGDGRLLDRGGTDSERVASVVTVPESRERAKQNAGTLSGGERQMLAIARDCDAPDPDAAGRATLGLAPRSFAALFEQIEAINRAARDLPHRENARRALPWRIAIRDGAGENRYSGQWKRAVGDEHVQTPIWALVAWRGC